MLLANIFKSNQCFKIAQFTSNPIVSMAMQRIQTHAKPRSWCEIVNDVNVTSVTLLTKRRRQRKSGAICMPLTARKLLNISRIRNSNVLYNMQDCCFWWFCMHYFWDSIGQLYSFTILWWETHRKMAAGLFLQVEYLPKIVLLWTCLLNSVKYERTFRKSVQYDNLLNVFFQCKVNGTIYWGCNNQSEKL